MALWYMLLFFFIAVITNWYFFMYHGKWQVIASYSISVITFFVIFPPSHLIVGFLQWLFGTIALILLGAGWEWLWDFHLYAYFRKQKIEKIEKPWED